MNGMTRQASPLQERWFRSRYRGSRRGAQTKWNLPAAYPADNFHSEKPEPVRQGRRGRHRRQAAHHGPCERLAVQGAGHQARRADRPGADRRGAGSLHENEDPVFGLDVVPFLATSFDQAKKLWEAQRPALEKKLEPEPDPALRRAVAAARHLHQEGINTVEDLRGTKWRAYNPGTARIAEIVGAQPVTIQAAELAQALATGVVNAFMTSGATGYDSRRYGSRCRTSTIRRRGSRRTSSANKAAFDALDKPTQDAIVKAAKTAEERGWRMSQEKTR